MFFWVNPFMNLTDLDWCKPVTITRSPRVNQYSIVTWQRLATAVALLPVLSLPCYPTQPWSPSGVTKVGLSAYSYISEKLRNQAGVTRAAIKNLLHCWKVNKLQLITHTRSFLKPKMNPTPPQKKQEHNLQCLSLMDCIIRYRRFWIVMCLPSGVK